MLLAVFLAFEVYVFGAVWVAFTYVEHLRPLDRPRDIPRSDRVCEDPPLPSKVVEEYVILRHAHDILEQYAKTRKAG